MMSKRLEFVNADKEKICAISYGRNNGRTVIYSHGLGSSKDSYKEQKKKWASMMNDKGIRMIFFDFRGCGKSEGKFDEVSISNYLKDLDSVIAATEGTMGLCGHSLGAAISMASAEKHKMPVVAVSPPTDFKEIIKSFLVQGGHAYERVRRNIDLDIPDKHIIRTGLRFYRDSKKYNFLKISKKIDKMMIIHGDKDEIVPIHQSERITKESGAGLVVFKGCGHKFEGRNFYRMSKLTTDFFAKNL